MKKIEAIIRKSKYTDVKEALHQVGVNFFSYWDVTGLGNEKEGHVYRGITYSTSDIQRRYLSIVVNDDDCVVVPINGNQLRVDDDVGLGCEAFKQDRKAMRIGDLSGVHLAVGRPEVEMATSIMEKL